MPGLPKHADVTEPEEASAAATPDERVAAAEALTRDLAGLRLTGLPKPWSLEQMTQFLRQVEDERKHLICSPARVPELEATVAKAGLGMYVDVVASPFVDDDLVILAASDREMRERLLEDFGQELRDSLEGGRHG